MRRGLYIAIRKRKQYGLSPETLHPKERALPQWLSACIGSGRPIQTFRVPLWRHANDARDPPIRPSQSPISTSERLPTVQFYSPGACVSIVNHFTSLKERLADVCVDPLLRSALISPDLLRCPTGPRLCLIVGALWCFLGPYHLQ